MDPIDALVAAVALAVSSTLAVTFGIGWCRATRRVRELEGHLNGAAPDTTLAQLETDLATLRENVEHLASGQDFLSRLVTERRQPPRVQQPSPGADAFQMPHAAERQTFGTPPGVAP